MNVVKDALRLARAEGGHVGIKLHVGPIHSRVSGRTDHLPVHVESNSYVLPAHHVSGLGESNTIAGFDRIERMFANLRREYDGIPYKAAGAIPYVGGYGPYGSDLHAAKGGPAVSPGTPIACLLAGGEYVLSPEEVWIAGDGDMEAGHRALDDWVKGSTKDLAKTISKLPPPRRD